MTAAAWAIYCRVSTDEQAQHGIGLEVQRTQCEAMATATGCTVAHVLVDEGYSGKDLKRPAVQQLLELVRGGQIAGVQVWKLDRLTRSLRDLISIVELLDQHRVGLVSIHERIDTSGPMGRFTLHLMGAIAQLERETIAQRVSSAMAHLRAKGNYVGGRKPIGTRVVGERGALRLEVDPAQQAAVVAAFEACRDGRSLLGLAVDLTEAGVYAKRPTPTIVGRALRNAQLVELGVVSSDLFQAAGQALDGRKARLGTTLGSTQASSRAWLLAGLARCALCGASLGGVTTTTRGTRYHYLRCVGRVRGCRFKDIPAEPWEQAVREAIVAAWADGSWLAAWRQHLAQAQAAASPDLASRQQLRDDRAQQQAQLDRLVDLVAQGTAVARAARPRLEACQARIEALDVQLAAIEGRVAAVEIAEQACQAMAQRLHAGVERLAELGNDEAREIIAGLVSSVIIGADSIELALLLPRSTSTNSDGRRLFVESRQVVQRPGCSTNTGPRIRVPVVQMRRGDGVRIELAARVRGLVGGSLAVAQAMGISRRQAQRWLRAAGVSRPGHPAASSSGSPSRSPG